MRKDKPENRAPKSPHWITIGHSSFVIRHLPCVSFLFAALLSLSGCQSPVQNLFTATGPDWQVQQGQAVWYRKTGMPEFGGMTWCWRLATTRDGNLIQFDKTPMEILSRANDHESAG